MNKKTIIVITIFVVLFLIFLGWSKIYSPINKTGRCRTSEDCAMIEPIPGFYYFCEEGKCIGREIGSEKKCLLNEDCVKATCCHTSEAVNQKYAPDCSDIFCTQECQEGTLDCGQGKIECVNGRCEAVLSS